MLKAIITPRKPSPEVEHVTVDILQEKEYCKDCLGEDDTEETEAVIEKKYTEEPQAGVIHRTVTRIKNYVAELPQIPQPSEKQLFNGAVGLASVGVAALALNVRRKTTNSSDIEQRFEQLEQNLDEANRKLGEAQARQAGGDGRPLREANSFHTVADSGQDLTQIQSSLADVQRSVEALSGLVQERQPQVDEQSAEQQTQILEKLGNLSRGIVFLVERIREVRAAQEQAPPAAVAGRASVDHSSHHVATQKKVDELWQEMYQVEDRIKTEITTILQAVQAQEGHFGIPEAVLERAMNQLLDGVPTLLSHANTEQTNVLNDKFTNVMRALLLLQQAPQSSPVLTAADRELIAGLHQAPVQREAVATADVEGLREIEEGVAALEERRKEDRARVDAVGETTDWIKRFLEENRDKILTGDLSQILLILQELQQREQQQTPVGLTEEAVRRILQEFKDELKREIPAPAAPKQEPPKPKPVPKPVEPPKEKAPEPKPAPKLEPKKVVPKPKPRPVTPPVEPPPVEEAPKPKRVFQLAKVTVNTSFFGGQKKQIDNLNAIIDRVNSSFENFSYTVQEADAINKQVEAAIGELLRKSSSRTPFYVALQRIKSENNQSLNAWKRGYVTNQETGKTRGNSSKLINWIKNFNLNK
jgi:outer membrane biosynthesis protein TonB